MLPLPGKNPIFLILRKDGFAMKITVKDKNSNLKEIRCDCNRYLFTISGKDIYVKCRRCKKSHKVEIVK